MTDSKEKIQEIQEDKRESEADSHGNHRPRLTKNSC